MIFICMISLAAFTISELKLNPIPIRSYYVAQADGQYGNYRGRGERRKVASMMSGDCERNAGTRSKGYGVDYEVLDDYLIWTMQWCEWKSHIFTIIW